MAAAPARQSRRRPPGARHGRPERACEAGPVRSPAKPALPRSRHAHHADRGAAAAQERPSPGRPARRADPRAAARRGRRRSGGLDARQLRPEPRADRGPGRRQGPARRREARGGGRCHRAGARCLARLGQRRRGDAQLPPQRRSPPPGEREHAWRSGSARPAPRQLLRTRPPQPRRPAGIRAARRGRGRGPAPGRGRLRAPGALGEQRQPLRLPARRGQREVLGGRRGPGARAPRRAPP